MTTGPGPARRVAESDRVVAVPGRGEATALHGHGAAGALRVLVTRPADQAGDWVEALQGRGIDAAALPLIGIFPPPDVAAVDAAWAALADTDLLFFVSPNAVAQFFARRPPGVAWPPATWAASPGPGTSRALREAGVPASRVVEPPADSPQFDSEALWTVLAGREWTGRRITVVRGDGGRDWLATRWREAGASVAFVAAYRRGRAVLSAVERSTMDRALAEPGRHLWFFSSSEAVDHLLAAAAGVAGVTGAVGVSLPPAGGDPRGPWPAASALATHPRIAERATAAGFGRVATCRPTLDAVVACIECLASPGADGAGSCRSTSDP